MTSVSAGESGRWAWEDLNLRPHPYQACSRGCVHAGRDGDRQLIGGAAVTVVVRWVLRLSVRCGTQVARSRLLASFRPGIPTRSRAAGGSRRAMRPGASTRDLGRVAENALLLGGRTLWPITALAGRHRTLRCEAARGSRRWYPPRSSGRRSGVHPAATVGSGPGQPRTPVGAPVLCLLFSAPARPG
jgi:hypothetical protein